MTKSEHAEVRWNIARAGRAWAAEEAQRLTVLALLLENVGVDQAIRLGDPEVWRAAIRELG